MDKIDRTLLKNELKNSEALTTTRSTQISKTEQGISRAERVKLLNKGVMTRWETDTKIPMEREEMTFLAVSLERHLTNTGCTPDRYDEVYDVGMRIYMEEGYGKGPFNTLYLLRAWDEIRASEDGTEKNNVFDAAEFDRIRQEAKANRTQCDSCKGSRITFTEVDGRRTILYETDEQGNKRPVACPDC